MVCFKKRKVDSKNRAYSRQWSAQFILEKYRRVPVQEAKQEM